MELIKIKKKFIGADKKEHIDIQFYIVLNGNRVRVCPYYFESKDGSTSFNTFKELSLLAKLENE